MKKKRYCLLSIHWEEQVPRLSLIALLNNMDIKKYDIYLYVVLNQGRDGKRAAFLCKSFSINITARSLCLSSKGKKVLIRGIFKNVFTWSCI